MSLTLNDIQNKNLLSAVREVIPKKGKTKDGLEYDYLDLVFVNGWSKRVFLGSDGAFGLLNAAELAKNNLNAIDSTSRTEDISQNSNLPF